LLEGFDWTVNLWESDMQMFEGLKQRIGMRTGGRMAEAGQRRSQDAQTGPEPLEQVIEGIQRQRRCRGLPGGPDRKTAEPPADRLPDQRGGETVPRQYPGEQNRKGAAAAGALPAVGTKYPLAPGDAALIRRRIVAVHPTMPIERTDLFAERTGRGFDRAKELLKTLRILYKNHMFQFLHRRKIEDLDELSNQANEAIRAGRWTEAESLCQRLRAGFPEELDADDRLAQLHKAQKNYAKALPYAQAALDKARHNPEKFDPELVADLEDQVDFLKKKTGA
jgi:tetratricopeptide (TPR) repeat protein